MSALLEPLYKRTNERLGSSIVSSRGFYVWRVLRTFIIVNIGWYFDRALRGSDAFAMLYKTFFAPAFAQLTDGTLLSLGVSRGGFLVLAGALLILITVSVMQERGIRMRAWLMERPLPIRWGLLYLLVFYTMLFFVPNAVTGLLYAAF